MKIVEYVTSLAILWDYSSKLEISDAKSCVLNASL